MNIIGFDKGIFTTSEEGLKSSYFASTISHIQCATKLMSNANRHISFFTNFTQTSFRNDMKDWPDKYNEWDIPLLPSVPRPASKNISTRFLQCSRTDVKDICRYTPDV